jgi:hypothetical protein
MGELLLLAARLQEQSQGSGALHATVAGQEGAAAAEGEAVLGVVAEQEGGWHRGEGQRGDGDAAGGVRGSVQRLAVRRHQGVGPGCSNRSKEQSHSSGLVASRKVGMG